MERLQEQAPAPVLPQRFSSMRPPSLPDNGSSPYFGLLINTCVTEGPVEGSTGKTGRPHALTNGQHGCTASVKMTGSASSEFHAGREGLPGKDGSIGLQAACGCRRSNKTGRNGNSTPPRLRAGQWDCRRNIGLQDGISTQGMSLLPMSPARGDRQGYLSSSTM